VYGEDKDLGAMPRTPAAPAPFRLATVSPTGRLSPP